MRPMSTAPMLYSTALKALLLLLPLKSSSESCRAVVDGRKASA